MKNQTVLEISQEIKKLTKSEKDFLLEIGTDGILRKFLSSNNIKFANKLVKKGLLTKGTTPDKHSSVMYYLDSFIERRLN